MDEQQILAVRKPSGAEREPVEYVKALVSQKHQHVGAREATLSSEGDRTGVRSELRTREEGETADGRAQPSRCAATQWKDEQRRSARYDGPATLRRAVSATADQPREQDRTDGNRNQAETQERARYLAPVLLRVECTRVLDSLT